eukprot:14332949-Heterocapsa_arctica.AAC.1
MRWTIVEFEFEKQLDEHLDDMLIEFELNKVIANQTTCHPTVKHISPTLCSTHVLQQCYNNASTVL